MILKPTIDTDFVMRTWQQKLGEGLVCWYPGHWKLRECKARMFSSKIFSSGRLENYSVHGKHQLIAYFEMHEHLLKCMEFKHHWKLTISTPPTKKIPQKSKKDKKSYSQQSKGKNLGKSLSPLTRLRNKSNTQQKTDDTRSLLVKLLNLLTHEHLLRCMEFSHHWKPTISTPPTKQKTPPKSNKDKKTYSQQSKGKNLGKSLNSSTRSRNKSNTQQKTDDMRPLLLKLLNLLV
ncbi:hypothetical protein RhiirA1_459213 [Rhizophagus irregularis]|uniref:Uncharacterized protein n=1 Tax=Rhizophagus irregularis TaxID=588596 RepID=A0A2N0RU52_9GLOM|nr:hypothetical protein RhiirA1_459213 [Rhizophagus irregularis]